MITEEEPMETEARGQRAFTLLEVLIVVALLGIIMIPVVSWGILAIQRSSNTGVQDDSTGLASVSRAFTRDVEAAAAASIDVSADCPNIPPAFGYSPVAALRGLELYIEEDIEGSIETQTVRTVYAVTEENGKGVLWRRRCLEKNGAWETSSSKLISGLKAINPGSTTASKYVQFECTDKTPLMAGATTTTSTTTTTTPGTPPGELEDSCRVVSVTLQTDRQGLTTLRAVRRPDPAPGAVKKPRAIITCLPSCSGYRDANQQMTVSFDASRSTNAVAYGWDFGNGNTSTDMVPPVQTYSCHAGITIGTWDATTKECRFLVRLTVLNDDSPPRKGTASTTVTVKNNPPRISVTPESVSVERSNDPVKFNTTGTVDIDGTSTFLWNFGDPASPNNTSTLQNPEHIYRSIITGGTATLTVTDNDGVSETIRIPVNVRNAAPVARFVEENGKYILDLGDSSPDAMKVKYLAYFNAPGSYDPDGGMPTNTSYVSVSSYQWSVIPKSTGVPMSAGNKNTDTLSLEFPRQSDVYTIYLKVTDSEGLENTWSREISVNVQPRSIIEVTPESRVITPANGTTNFLLDGSKSFDPDSDPTTPVKWRWEVRRVGQSSLAVPAYESLSDPTYALGSLPVGNYDVRLIVEDKYGSKSPAVDTRVLSGPPARPTVRLKVNDVPTVQISGYASLDIQRQKPHTYSPSASTGDSDGTIVQYKWEFRDANTNSLITSKTIDMTQPGASPDLVYTFPGLGLPRVRATLTATDNDGGYRSHIVEFQVTNAAPTASFTISPSPLQGTDGTSAKPAVFTFGNTSDDIDGSLTTCTWTIQNPGSTPATTYTGGCNTPPIASVTHQWTTGGVYTITLEATDNEGKVSAPKASRQITVAYYPVASFTMNPPAATFNNQNISFDSSSSNDNLNPNPTISSRVWDFGDGTPADTTVAPFHAFTRTRPSNVGVNGQFMVRLTVTNFYGLSSTAEQLMRVNAPPVAIVNDVATSPTTNVKLLLNCPNVSGQPAQPDCSIPRDLAPGYTLNGLGAAATGSYDPDGAADHVSRQWMGNIPTGLYQWIDPLNYIHANVATPTLASPLSLNPTSYPYYNNLYYGSTKVIYYKVRDADLTWSANTSVDITTNRPPAPGTSNVFISGTLALERSVNSTPAQVTTDVTDFEDTANGATTLYSWVFKDAGGVTVATSSAKVPVVKINSNFTGGSVELTVTDANGFAKTAVRTGLSVSDAKPVGVILTPTVTASTAGTPAARNDTASTLVLTRASGAGQPGTLTVTFDGFTGSYDPDGLPGPTQGPVLPTYEWKVTKGFGTGGPLGITTPLPNLPFTQTFTGYGTWEIDLTVHDASGLSGTKRLTVKINQPPTTVFACTAVFGDNVANALTFANQSTDLDVGTSMKPAFATWNWGDGSPVVQQAWSASTQHIFTGYGTFSVSLTVTDIDGISGATINCPNVARVNPKPVSVPVGPANSTDIVIKNAGPYAVNFTSSDSYDPGREGQPNKGISAWEWKFYSGGTSAVGSGTLMANQPAGPPAATASTSYTFPSTPGIYWADLKVTDNETSTNTTRIKIRVNAKPTAVIQPTDMYFQRAQAKFITGSSSSDSDGTIASYEFTFLPEPTAANQAPLAHFGPAITNGYNVTINKRVPEVTAPPNAQGVAILKVTDNDGDSTTITNDYSVNNGLPIAIINSTPEPPVVINPAPITFDSVFSVDDGTITNFAWQFVNLSTNQTITRTGAHPGPIVFAAGSWEARLTLTDDDTEVGATATKPFTVRGRPVARITTSPSTTMFQGAQTRAVSIDGLATTDADDPTTSLQYDWTITNKFGEVLATQAGAAPFVVEFSGFGQNTISLTVTDPGGLSHTTTKMVVLNQPPTVLVAATPPVRNPGQGTQFSFDPLGTNDADGTIISYQWGFYDKNGTTTPGSGTLLYSPPSASTGAPVSYTFPTTPGTYYAELIVTDNSLGQTTKRVAVRINQAPTAVMPSTTFALTRGVPFEFDASGSTDPDSQLPQYPDGIKLYRWYFYNENMGLITSFDSVSAIANIPINLLVPLVPGGGQGTVKLQVVDANDAVSVEVSKPFTVINAAPQAVIFSDPTYLVDTSPLDVNFYQFLSSDSDGTITSYRWKITPQGSSTALVDVTTSDPNAPVFYSFVPTGMYDISLTVTDDLGATNTATTTAKVNQAPTAVIANAGSLTATSGVAKSFDASEPTYSNDVDGDITTYEWVFYDPNANIIGIQNGAVVSQTFGAPGTYAVQLTVTDNDGAVASTQITQIGVT